MVEKNTVKIKKSNTKSPSEFNEAQKKLFVETRHLVDKIVNKLRAKLPAHADIDELHSAGMMGLADAVKRFDPTRADRFYSYASTRIRGAIIDELRDIDYMSRSARSDAKNLEKLRSSLEQEYGRDINDEEVRAEMGVSRKQFDKILRRTQSYAFISLNDNPNDDSDASIPSFSESIADENAKPAYADIERLETILEIRRNVAKLPEKQRKVLEAHFFQHKKLGEIAKEFGLTEARISQIQSQALNTLRPMFNN
jgi:RNA polymerase sigma factor for flagellar operon FliA